YFVTKRISMLEVMLPSAIKAKYTKVFAVKDTEAIPEKLLKRFDSEGHYAYKVAQKNEDLTLIAPFLKQGAILEDTILSQSLKKKKQRAVRIVEGFNDDTVLESLEKSKKQYELYAYLIDENHHVVFLKQLEEMGFSKSSIETLVRKGFIEKYDTTVERDPFATRVFEQDQKQQRTVLLHGVTGSGKTEVYLQTIENVLNQGKQAMMLVPEIALTPQMVLRFKRRFGDEVAVLHSGLSKGERYDEWQKIRDGKASVSVGARSSVFAPFKDLGMIIIDEEHESSYKQEDYPRYHARDIAQWRSQYHHCPL